MPVHMGVGVSGKADRAAAGREAAELAIAHLAGRRPDLWIIFSPLRFADPSLLKSIRAISIGTPLIGCTDAGGLVTAGPQKQSVIAIGLAGEGVRFLTGLARHVSSNPKAAGEALAKSFQAYRPVDPRGLLLFSDGLTASGSEILAGVQRVIGQNLPILGGCSGDDFHFQKTFQYFNDEVLTDSVPAVLITGEVLIGFGARHGWLPVGRPRQVTRAAGHVIHTLDRRPAVSIYEDYLGLSRSELREEPIAKVAITYPLGAPRAGHKEYLLRGAIRVGRGGSLICSGSVQEGSAVQLMIGGYEAALEAAQQAAQEAASKIGRDRVNGALVFSSVARQKMLGSEFQGEVDVIRDALGGSGVRLGGFYSYGEYAGNHFQNESVVVMVMGA